MEVLDGARPIARQSSARDQTDLIAPHHKGTTMGHKNTVRVVTRAADGTLRIRDYPTTEPLLEMHTQIGTTP